MPRSPFDIIPKVLTNWGRKQKNRLIRAFSVGGHQLHGGDSWVPLDPSTGGGVPLSESGSLKRGTFYKVSGVSVIVGNSSRIAIYHQNGTRSIPKRPVVVVTKRDIAELKQDLKKAVEQQMRIR